MSRVRRRRRPPLPLAPLSLFPAVPSLASGRLPQQRPAPFQLCPPGASSRIPSASPSAPSSSPVTAPIASSTRSAACGSSSLLIRNDLSIPFTGAHGFFFGCFRSLPPTRAGGSCLCGCSLDTAGPKAAWKITQRWITLICAGLCRGVIIPRELPRTRGAGWSRGSYRMEPGEDSPFRRSALPSAPLSRVKSFT
jgi:hypothetical protein